MSSLLSAKLDAALVGSPNSPQRTEPADQRLTLQRKVVKAQRPQTGRQEIASFAFFAVLCAFALRRKAVGVIRAVEVCCLAQQST
jgi:hypothetical protein